MLKSEARILVTKKLTVDCVSSAVTIYVIARGVRGIEHLGLVEGLVTPNGILRMLGRTSQEIRVVLGYEDALRLASAGNVGPDALGDILRSALNVLDRLGKEINRLLCRDNYLNNS